MFLCLLLLLSLRPKSNWKSRYPPIFHSSIRGMKDDLIQNALMKVRAVYADLANRPIERQCIARTQCCQFRLTGLTPELTKGEALLAAKVPIEAGEITNLPIATIPVPVEQAQKLLRMVDAFEDNEDIQVVSPKHPDFDGAFPFSVLECSLEKHLLIAERDAIEARVTVLMEHAYASGTEIRLAFPKHRRIYFDRDGKRLS